MHSVKRACACLVLLFGFIPMTARTQPEGKKVLAEGGPIRAAAGTAFIARRVNGNNASSTDTPEGSSSAQVSYFNSEQVTAALSPDAKRSPGHNGENTKTGVLLDWKDGENKYLVRVSHVKNIRRLAEVHSFTHVWYIQEGSATLVTGGTLVNPRPVEPTPWGGEDLIGTAIEGGVTRHVSKGDVIVVPQGIPHRWTDVQDPFTYFVVNIR